MLILSCNRCINIINEDNKPFVILFYNYLSILIIFHLIFVLLFFPHPCFHLRLFFITMLQFLIKSYVSFVLRCSCQEIKCKPSDFNKHIFTTLYTWFIIFITSTTVTETLTRSGCLSQYELFVGCQLFQTLEWHLDFEECLGFYTPILSGSDYFINIISRSNV